MTKLDDSGTPHMNGLEWFSNGKTNCQTLIQVRCFLSYNIDGSNVFAQI
jgi:hypothetical protein